jgi:uncharacterized protein (DUF1330 family)
MDYYSKYLKYKSKYINLIGGDYLIEKNKPSAIIDDIIAENDSVILLNNNIPIFKLYSDNYYSVIKSERKTKNRRYL